jgi:predicted transcriptional regulator
MKKITKRKAAMPVFRRVEGSWQTLPEPQALEVMRAELSEVRRGILRLLELGPMRKSELARYIHIGLGKKYSRSLVQHHLKQLVRAGLVGYVGGPKVPDKTRLVCRTANVRVQIMPRAVPKEAPIIPEEVIKAQLRRRFRRG